MMKEFEKIENFGKDEFKLSFDGIDEFLLFLKARERSTKRISVPGNMLNFVTIGDSRKWYRSNEVLSERLGVKPYLIEDTEKNMDMILVIDGQPYLVGSSAWISIKNRVDIYGKGFDRLESLEQVRDINAILSDMKALVQVIVVEDKVRAIMSSEYSVVRGDQLFSQVLANSAERFDGCDLVEASLDYNTTRCKVVFNSLKEELASIYDMPDMFVPGIIIESSDTGHSGNKIGSFWRDDKGRTFINPEDYIYMKHRGSVSIDKIVDELPNIFLKYQDTIKKFAEMVVIEINNPIATLKAAGKKIGLTRKEIKFLSENMELNLGGRTSATAYDVCQEILSLSAFAEREEKVSIEEKIGKAVNLDYAKLSKEA